VLMANLPRVWARVSIRWMLRSLMPAALFLHNPDINYLHRRPFVAMFNKFRNSSRTGTGKMLLKAKRIISHIIIHGLEPGG